MITVHKLGVILSGITETQNCTHVEAELGGWQMSYHQREKI